MKKLFFFAAFLCGCLTSNAQSAVTIDQSNFPLAKGTHLFRFRDTAIATPQGGANQTWDYTKLGTTDTFSQVFNTNTNSAFSSSALVITSTQDLNSSAHYVISNYYDEDANGFFSPGASTEYQAYGLGGFTGNSKDSFYVLKQDIKYRENLVNFPATNASGWTSDFKETINFLITYNPIYNKTSAATHISVNEKNNVTGWGVLKLPGTGGSAVDYNVLMVKSANVYTDSFFLNNKPAPGIILSGFGMKQGAKNYSYQINFYATGSALPIATIDYGNDSTFTNSVSFTYETNVKTALADNNVQSPYVTIYPNPASGNTIQLSLMKNDIEPYIIHITNILGQNIKNIRLSGSGALNVPVDLTAVQSGIYNVSISSADGSILSTQKLIIAR
jgi:hypothetical protein